MDRTIQALRDLIEICQRLLFGCPHDRDLPASSWIEYAHKELNELSDALTHLKDPRDAQEELGDALFCVLMTGLKLHNQGLFKLADAIDGIREKMIKRHPHVFGDAKAKTAEEANKLFVEAKNKPSVTLQYRPKVPGSMGTFSDWVDYDRTAYSVFEHERHLAEEHAKELTKNISHLGYEFRVKPPSNELPPPRCITEPCKKCGLMKGSMTAHGICSDCWWTTRGRVIRNPEFDANFCSKSKDGKHELDQNVDVYCRHCGRSSIHPIHPEEVEW